jgi:hypothetical protein
MSLVQSALYEAEHLAREVHDQARDRYLDHDQASQPLDADELSRLLSEAYQCTTLASTYIDKAAMGLLDPGAQTPPKPRSNPAGAGPGGQPPSSPASHSKPSSEPIERGEWRVSRYQDKDGRSCVGRHAATTPAARELASPRLRSS